jgi:hypothetical protein
MTTDTELHDLLTAEAGGPTTGASWDDVVRRGRHRQRMRRAQGVALGALVGMAVVTAISMSGDDPNLETTVTEPTSTLPYETTTSTPVEVPPGEVPRGLGAARVQGAFLTVIIPAADPTVGFDPCTDLHPRTPQSAEQIGIALETKDEWRGEPWAACQSSPFSAFGTIELQEPYAGQPVLDLSTGDTITVIDGGPLLFPGTGTLPEPFDLEHWDEFGATDYEGTPVEHWTFSWTAGDVVLSIGQWDLEGERPDGCTEQRVQVRGVLGHLCDSASSSVLLTWADGTTFHTIELVDVSGEPLVLEGADLVAIADGLEPLGG